MYVQVGECKMCGAPMHVPKMWNGIIPPTPIRTCSCLGNNNSQRGMINTIGTSGSSW